MPRLHSLTPKSAFNDLCYWLSQGQTLWTHDSYYTDDYYCNPSWHPGVCVRLQIQYWCGSMWEGPVSDANPAGAVRVDYAGCMVSNTLGVSPDHSHCAVLTTAWCRATSRTPFSLGTRVVVRHTTVAGSLLPLVAGPSASVSATLACQRCRTLFLCLID